MKYYLQFFMILANCLLLQVQTLYAQSPGESGVVRAQLVARQMTTLSSELAAKINEMQLHKGDRFRKAERLVSFDCKVEQAKLRRAQASLALDRKSVEVNKRLAELQSISIMEVEKSIAEVKETEADLAVMEAIVDKCVIYAPFSGKVVELKAREHQYVSAGKELVEILDDNDLEVEVIVPSLWLIWLKTGMSFSLHIDETGKQYKAVVSRIGASIDSVSQSIEIMGKIQGSNKDLLPGMSGTAKLKK